MATVMPVLFGIPEPALLSFATVLENTNGGRITEVLPMISDTGIEILRYQCDQDLLDAAADEKTESEAGHAESDEGDGQDAKPETELFGAHTDDEGGSGQGDEAGQELPDPQSTVEGCQFLPGRLAEPAAVRPQLGIQDAEDDPLDGQTRIGQGDQAGDREGKQEMAKDLRR
jgi:hypothetical protein